MNSENKKMTPSHNQINHLIGVMSAKGGVGKSFTTGLLACELARQGYQVGILDADFTGSSIPLMFGLQGSARAGKYSFLPLQSYSGVKIISLNSLLANQDQSVIWKEALIGKVIEELWKEVEWGSLDYLFVDMPPATSQAGVAIMQALPFKGMIIVTTPQDLATKIVNKSVKIAQKIGVLILGVVENMAYYLSPGTGTKEYIFGQFHGESVANIANAPVLSQIPYDPDVTRLCDSGKIEELLLEEAPEFVELFVKSLADVEAREAFLLSESQSAERLRASANREGLVGEPPTRDQSPSSQVNNVSDVYSNTVIHLIRSKENMGVLDHPDAQGHFLGSCGDRMQIDLRIIAGRIIEARFMADGCGVTLACGSMITKMACSKTLEQAGQITPDDLLVTLGGLPADHEHCAELAVMTLREAVIDAIEGKR